MTTRFIRPVTVIAIASSLVLAPTTMSAETLDTQVILQEIQALKKSYEGRIAKLEDKLKELEEKRLRQTATAPAPATSGRSIYDNSFNPSIGVIRQSLILFARHFRVCRLRRRRRR